MANLADFKRSFIGKSIGELQVEGRLEQQRMIAEQQQARLAQEGDLKQREMRATIYQTLLQSPNLDPTVRAQVAAQAEADGFPALGKFGAQMAGPKPQLFGPGETFQNYRLGSGEFVETNAKGEPELKFKPHRPQGHAPKARESFIAVHRETGERRQATFNPNNGQMTEAGTGNLLGLEWLPTTAAVQATDYPSINPTQQGKEEVKARNERIALDNYLAMGDRRIANISANPAATGAGGKLAAFAVDVVADAKSLLKAVGYKADFRGWEAQSPDFWGEWAGATNDEKAWLYSSGVMAAAALGVGQNRDLSDRDVANQLRLEGNELSDPNQRIRRIKGNMETLIIKFNNRAKHIYAGSKYAEPVHTNRLSAATQKQNASLAELRRMAKEDPEAYKAWKAAKQAVDPRPQP